jgi:hypothetical protein
MVVISSGSCATLKKGLDKRPMKQPLLRGSAYIAEHESVEV